MGKGVVFLFLFLFLFLIRLGEATPSLEQRMKEAEHVMFQDEIQPQLEDVDADETVEEELEETTATPTENPEVATEPELWEVKYKSLFSLPGTVLSNEIQKELVVAGKPTARHTQGQGRPFIIMVEGNVGSGKSTLLKLLGARSGVATFPEQVATWQDVGGQNLLEAMYSQPARWTTTFQLFSSLTRLQDGLTARHSGADVVLLERGLFSERYCFVQMLADAQVISNGEFALLDRYFKTITGEKEAYPSPDLILYIRSDPQVLAHRINSRGRREEENMDWGFLNKLHQMHEDWLIHRKYPVAAPVVVLDGNLELADFTASVNSWADSLWALNKERKTTPAPAAWWQSWTQGQAL